MWIFVSKGETKEEGEKEEVKLEDVKEVIQITGIILFATLFSGGLFGIFLLWTALMGLVSRESETFTWDEEDRIEIGVLPDGLDYPNMYPSKEHEGL